MAMSTFARSGDKVVFCHRRAGDRFEQEDAAEFLEYEMTYTVDAVTTAGAYPKVFLQEIPENVAFPTAMFEDQDYYWQRAF